MLKKVLVLTLGIVFCGVQAARAASVTLAWDPNTEPDLAGYELHYGTSSGSYTQVQTYGRTATQGTVAGLLEGNTYYFALKAFDTDGNRSGFSNQAVAEIPGTPPPPPPDEPLGPPGQPYLVQ